MYVCVFTCFIVFFHRNLLYECIICTCQDLYEILKNFICLSFDEIKFDFVIQVFYNEVNNVLFNGYVSYFVNFIVKLKIYVFLEEFEFLQKINNDLSVLLKQIE